MMVACSMPTSYLPDDLDVSVAAPADLVLSPLTPSQSLVARAIADGLTNGQIAERLCLSKETVGRYKWDIAGRLGLSGGDTHTRVRIAHWVWQHAR